jgi:hypothetical protein
MKRLFFIIITFTVILASCRTKAELTKRYNSIALSENDSIIKKYIKVNAYLIEKEKVEKATPKTIFDLSPQGQAALIREISNKETGTDKLLAGLKCNLSSKAISSDDIIDDSQFERRIVLSIRNTSHIPADRIQRISITLSVDPVVKMISCDKLTTAYQTLDLGKTDYSSTQNAEVTGNAAIGAGTTGTVTNNKDTFTTTANTNAGISGKLSSSNSYSEEVLLKQRIVALNSSLTANTLSFYQEGISGMDLTGNILIDITFRITDVEPAIVYSFLNLAKNETFNDSSSIEVNETKLIYPNLTNDVNAEIKFEADYRKVTKHDETISESDDSVILYYGKSTNSNVVLIPKNMLKPKLYILTSADDKDKMPIKIKNPSNIGSSELLFNSYNDARDFLLWLKSKYNDTKNKKEITIGSKKFVVTMPDKFTTINNIIIYPFNWI